MQAITRPTQGEKMPVSLRLRTVVISAAVVAALGSGAATASAATTTHSQPATQATCPDGWCGLWGTVEAQPFVNVRWGPSESYTIKATRSTGTPSRSIATKRASGKAAGTSATLTGT